MKIHFIVNPSSGKEEAVDRVNDIVRLFDEKGYETTTFYTEEENDAKNDAQSIERGVDLIVACGGDGTVNEVVQGLAEVNSNTPFTVYPQGTVNDFATYLNIPTDAETFVRMIERNQVIPLDIGKMDDTFFLNVAAFGVASRIGHDVGSDQKANLGRFAYILEGLRLAPEMFQDVIEFTIETDTRDTLKGEYLFVAVTNTQMVGGFQKVAPEASISDGQFDVIAIERGGLPQISRILLQLNDGGHIDEEGVVYFQASNIKITTNPPCDVDIDGENGGQTPKIIEVLPSHLRCLANFKEENHGEYTNN